MKKKFYVNRKRMDEAWFLVGVGITISGINVALWRPGGEWAGALIALLGWAWIAVGALERHRLLGEKTEKPNAP